MKVLEIAPTSSCRNYKPNFVHAFSRSNKSKKFYVDATVSEQAPKLALKLPRKIRNPQKKVASRLNWSFRSGNGTHTRNSGSRNVKNVHGRGRCRGSLFLTWEYTGSWRRWGKTSELLTRDLTHVSLLASNLLQPPAQEK
ncbi:hypothetical protein PIB30_088672 [Stylosanthes scabra]|uniref:Uncharacterized protein n=1 Tax=Stylosanthes scabra TaxID=79078 RepID=A0ABU6VS85_9FABA|nr:hypothetical protein [Stylosanthes scabra]